MATLKGRKILIGVTNDVQITFHEQLALELKEMGFEVHLVSSQGPNMSRLDGLVFCHQLEMKRNPDPFHDCSSLVEWFKLIRRIKPDLVMVGTPKASLLGILSSWALRVPSRIYFVHGLRLETANGVLEKVLLTTERLTSAMSTDVIAVSPSLQEKITSLGIARADKVKVLASGSTQGVDIKKFKPANKDSEREQIVRSLGLSPTSITIGFVGRLTADKGITELQKAACALHESGLEIQLLLVGKVEDEYGQQALNNLQNAGITFAAIGHVSDVSRYFRGMDIFCLPSYREGLPNVVLEAFASNVPVVASEVTGITDLIQHGHTGLLVPPRNYVELSNALESMVKDEHQRESLARNARSLVDEQFISDYVTGVQISYLAGQLS